MQSFYLPGSIDLEDQQLEQWNLKPPPLSLWSRSDWTMKHQEITIRYNLMPVDYNSAATQDGCGASPCGWRNVQKKIKSYKKSVRFKDEVGMLSTNKSSHESISPSIARSEASELPSAGEINRSSSKLPTEGYRQILSRLYGRRATADPSPLNNHVGGESDIAMDKVTSPP